MDDDGGGHWRELEVGAGLPVRKLKGFKAKVCRYWGGHTRRCSLAMMGHGRRTKQAAWG